MEVRSGHSEAGLAIHETFYSIYSSFLIKLIDQIKNKELPITKYSTDLSTFKDGSTWFQILVSKGDISDLDLCPSQVFVPMWFLPPFTESNYAIAAAGNALRHEEANRKPLFDNATAIMMYAGVRQDRDPVIDGIKQIGVAIDAEIVANTINQYYSEILTWGIHSFEASQYIKIPHLNLTPVPLFARHINDKVAMTNGLNRKDLALVALDKGSLQKILHAAKLLDFDLLNQVIVLNKEHTGHNQLGQSNLLFGNPENRYCIILDDVIDTGGSIAKTCGALLESGAKGIDIMSESAVLTMPARQNITRAQSEGIINDVVITNSLPFGFKLKGLAKEVSIIEPTVDFMDVLLKVNVQQILQDPSCLDRIGYSYLKDFILIPRYKEIVWQEFQNRFLV